jgi:hypothetical protein
MATEIKVVLFEDVRETRSEILDALQKCLKSDGAVLPFDAELFKEPTASQNRMYEDRLESILSKPPYDGATLLVADRDLSMSPNFQGMSVSAVIEAAKRLGIAICAYARQPAPEDYKWRVRWEEGHVILSSTEDADLAREAIVAARGFAEIASMLPAIVKDEMSKSPAKTLAALLGKPEYADKIALYGVGDQNRLSQVPAKGKKDNGDWVRRIGCFLGYWLWDSILRYPGLLVNEVAAASHLNIATADFRKGNVRGVFDNALYDGPFADPDRPHWWRGMMDDIVSREGYNDGLELIRQKLGEIFTSSQCWVDPSKPAGYYCIISEKPVSLENSRGGLSWLPRGADLSRITTSLFEEYGPWIGS